MPRCGSSSVRGARTASRTCPSLLRLAQELAGTGLRFGFYGLPSPFKNEPEATKWGVTGGADGDRLIGAVKKSKGTEHRLGPPGLGDSGSPDDRRDGRPNQRSEAGRARSALAGKRCSG